MKLRLQETTSIAYSFKNRRFSDSITRFEQRRVYQAIDDFATLSNLKTLQVDFTVSFKDINEK